MGRAQSVAVTRFPPFSKMGREQTKSFITPAASGAPEGGETNGCVGILCRIGTGPNGPLATYPLLHQANSGFGYVPVAILGPVATGETMAGPDMVGVVIDLFPTYPPPPPPLRENFKGALRKGRRASIFSFTN